MSAGCSFAIGQTIVVAGVTNPNYNTTGAFVEVGCNGGNTFSYRTTLSGLAASSGGTATVTFNLESYLVPSGGGTITVGNQQLWFANETADGNWHLNWCVFATNFPCNPGTKLTVGSNGNILMNGGGCLFMGPGNDVAISRSGANSAGVGTTCSDFSGAWRAGSLSSTEAAAPSGAASQDILFGDSPTHTPSWNNNNSGASSPTGAWQCTNVTSVTVSANSTSPQNLMSCSIPAGTLNRVGRTLRIWLSGIYSTPAASTTAVVITVKLGALTVATWTSTALAGIQATNDQWNVTGWITTQTAGATASFEAHGNMDIDLGVGNTVADSNFADVNTATVGTLDTTAAQTLQVTSTTTVGQAAGFSASQRQMALETVN